MKNSTNNEVGGVLILNFLAVFLVLLEQILFKYFNRNYLLPDIFSGNEGNAEKIRLYYETYRIDMYLFYGLITILTILIFLISKYFKYKTVTSILACVLFLANILIFRQFYYMLSDSLYWSLFR